MGTRVSSRASHAALTIQLYGKRGYDSAVVGEWTRLAAVGMAAADRIAQLAHDPDYTPTGRQKAIVAERERALAALQPLRDRVAAYHGRINAIENEALPHRRVARTTADLPQFLLEREIRDLLRAGQHDETTIGAMYLEAATRGDYVFMRAVEDAPQAFALLPERSTWREQARAALLAASPKASELAQLQEEAGAYEEVLASIVRDIRGGGRFETAAVPVGE